MTKHKVQELEGALLDAAVAMAEQRAIRYNGNYLIVGPIGSANEVADICEEGYRPSFYWECGGQIIEREGISLEMLGHGKWSANFEIYMHYQARFDDHTGPTPLIAAMRAYVASKFGDEIELPW